MNIYTLTKKLFLIAGWIVLGLPAIMQGQILNPVKWSSEWKHIDGDEFEIIFNARVQTKWAVYSMYLDRDDGPVATSLNFDDESLFSNIGKAKEGGDRKAGFDPIFEMNVVKFERTYSITQRIKVSDYSRPITGYLNYMTCDDTQCLPPTDYDFSFKLSPQEKESTPVTKPAPTSPPQEKQQPDKTTPDLEDKIDQTKIDAKSDIFSPLDVEDGLLEPVKWSGSIEGHEDGSYTLQFTADIDKGWQIYSQYGDEDDGPIPTSFILNTTDGTEVSEFTESGPGRVKEYDHFFEMDLVKFKDQVVFSARITTDVPGNLLSGYLEFMACDDTKCLPPAILDFNIDFERFIVNIEGQGDLLTAGKTKGEGTPVYQEFDYENANETCGDTTPTDEDMTNWFWIFLLGFGGGLIAILTPCVFPMIPLTISFFTKSSNSRASSIRNAVNFGLSIIVIYLVLGLLVTGIFGADALNLLSTNAWFNIFFALLFVVFAISFFGYFEITLPSSWVNKADQASDKGGLLGIFFMAFTLSLVSFSCTGPIIGTLIVETAVGGGPTILGRIPLGPLVGMFGFALALALPFALFAAFPGWLNTLPRSGGWMNSVKVSLGFVEIALALKFLSIADLTMGWKILPYEAFVFLWILCALGLAFYYFGWIKFPHDSPKADISNLRKGLGISMLALAVYFSLGFRFSDKSETFLTPNLLSGLAPPAGHSYIYPKPCPLNLNCFKDYEEGVAFARKNNKPILIDFTGHGCVNCRRIEDQVWSQDEIYDIINEKYVLISLYVDERKALEETYVSVFDGKVKRNVGNKWADFQAIHFNRNSQPYYVLSTADGKILNQPIAYVPDIKEYKAFLECGLTRFNALN